MTNWLGEQGCFFSCFFLSFCQNQCEAVGEDDLLVEEYFSTGWLNQRLGTTVSGSDFNVCLGTIACSNSSFGTHRTYHDTVRLYLSCHLLLARTSSCPLGYQLVERLKNLNHLLSREIQWFVCFKLMANQPTPPLR